MSGGTMVAGRIGHDSEKRLSSTEESLLDSRREILHLVDDFETGWKDLGEPETELEESAQKEDISQLLDQLEERERQRLMAIDAALQKMAVGTYGYCESCGKTIPKKAERHPFREAVRQLRQGGGESARGSGGLNGKCASGCVQGDV